MMGGQWKQLKNRQYDWYYVLIVIICLPLLISLLIYQVSGDKDIIWKMGAVFGVGVLLLAAARFALARRMKISKMMEKFIRGNNLCQFHHVKEQGILGEWNREKMDYYPTILYREARDKNMFFIKIRMDGSPYSEKFRDLEQSLADMFCTVCTEKIEERGYLTYCFEISPQKQVKIQTYKDIMTEGENEIAFSKDMVWDWKRCPHLLLTGNTGSGKTQLAQYIISCLLEQGVRVIYCDPKNDDDMRLFIQNKLSVVYATKENDIARVVRETEEEVRVRERDLQEIDIKEAEFNPVFLFFDEMIAFSKIANRKTYEETVKRLNTITVTGRSKRVYTGMILQRPDTSYVEGAIRDNLGCRICMGQMSEAAYKMAFGSDFSDIKNNRREIGSGLIYRQGVDTKPREFLAPFIEKGALSGE